MVLSDKSRGSCGAGGCGVSVHEFGISMLLHFPSRTVPRGPRYDWSPIVKIFLDSHLTGFCSLYWAGPAILQSQSLQFPGLNCGTDLTSSKPNVQKTSHNYSFLICDMLVIHNKCDCSFSMFLFNYFN